MGGEVSSFRSLLDCGLQCGKNMEMGEESEARHRGKRIRLSKFTGFK